MKRFCLGLLLALALVDCGGGDGGPPMITAVVVSGDSTVVLAGTRQLTAAAFSGSSQVSSGVTFQWGSSNGTVASVSTTGLVSGAQRGSVTITATAVLNGTPTTIAGTRGIRVRIGSVSLTPTAPQFPSLGDSVLVTAEARDAINAAVPGITFAWVSRTPSVASAAPRVNTALGDVVAVANGTARIVVTGDGVSDSVTATVRQVAATLSITPDTARFDRLGADTTPVITATDARGNAVPASALGWTSQSTAVATVNTTTGAVTPRGNGQTRVIATSGALADTIHVEVQQVATRVKLHPQTVDTSRILTTGSMRMIDSVFDASDSLIRTPAPTVTWSSTTAAATVDGAGVVTAGASPDTTYIKAVSGTAADSAFVQVVSTPVRLGDNATVGTVQNIFSTTACTGCHFGPTGAEGMSLVQGQARANIVGVAAHQSGLLRVLALVPDSSYLVHKVQGTHRLPPANGQGERMPLGCAGAGCLTRAQINLIRNWILQGALNN
jgi:hypothetical protein